jgi:hypothetical protein
MKALLPSKITSQSDSQTHQNLPLWQNKVTKTCTTTETRTKQQVATAAAPATWPCV